MTEITKKSTCHLCLAYCGIKVTIKDNMFIKIVSDFDDPRSQGYICEKAQKLIGFQHNKHRIQHPLKKVNDKFVSISWNQAIDEIYTKLKKIVDNKREDKIFYMASAVPDYRSIYRYELIKKLGVKFVSNVFSMEKMYPAMVNTNLFGTAILPDTENSQTHIVIGQNPWVTQHFPQARKVLNAFKNDLNRKLIVIDPCDTETTKIADHHIKIKPGTDAWLLSALIKMLITNNYVDQSFIATQTTNYDKILKHFSTVDLNECLIICGVTCDQLHNIAEIINSSTSVSFSTGNGICHGGHPMASSYLVILIYMITGNFQKLGAMNIDHDSVQPGMIADHYFTESHVPFNKQKQYGGVTPASLIVENLYIDDVQKFDCVIIDNNNPAGRFPDSDRFKSQLAKVGFVIALDSFETPSTRLADYVLPVPTFFESYEIPPSHDKIFQLCEPIVSSDHKPADEIFELLLGKLNLIDNKKLSTYKELYQTDKTKFIEILLRKYINKVPEVYHVLQHVIGHEYKNKLLVVIWWKFFILVKDSNSIENAVALADEWTNQLNDIGWAKLSYNKPFESKIDLTPGYMLLTLKLSKSRLTNSKFNFILQCGYRQKNSMNNIIPNTNDPLLEVSKEDMEQLAIIDNEEIIVETNSAEIKIRCRSDENLQPGLIRIANHAIINQLTDTKSKDYLNPQYKMVFANIRKLNNGLG